MIRSRIWTFVAAAIAGVSAMTGPAPAQPIGSHERGRELAAKLCTGCHVISPSSSGPRSSDVPSFPAMANRQGASAEQLAGRIIVPHPAMPGVPITANEIRDLVTYIMSFKEN